MSHKDRKKIVSHSTVIKSLLSLLNDISFFDVESIHLDTMLAKHNFRNNLASLKKKSKIRNEKDLMVI